MKNNYFNADHTHALIDLPPVFRLKKSSSFLKVDLLTGLITIEYLRVALPGELATEHSRYRILMLVEWLAISRIKKSVIVSELMRKSMRCS